MSRNAYTLAVLRWPQAQLVQVKAADPDEPTARHLLNQLFETDQEQFAMYANFMDGWAHTEHVFSHDLEDSLFRLLGAQQLLENLVMFHPSEVSMSMTLWEKYKKLAHEHSIHSLNQYAVDSMFHWLDVGFGFMEATGLPMLVAHDTIGGTLGDDHFQAGVIPETFELRNKPRLK